MTYRNPTTGIALNRLRSLRLSLVVLLFALATLVIAWAVVSLELRHKRAAAIDAEIRQNTNLARVLQEQTLRVLASIDQATLRMRDSIAAGEFTSEMSVRFASETGLVPDILTQLAFVGPDGRFVGSNLDPRGVKTGHVDLSEREHIRAHLKVESIEGAVSQFSSTGLFVGKPVLGKVSGKWTIQLSRRIDGPDGKVLGVIVASLNPGYLEEVYGRVTLGANGVVTLLGDDRSLRARVLDGQPRGMGMQLPDAYQSPARAGAREGHELRTSSIDGIERIVAYHRVGDYPLLLLVGSTTDKALSEWRDSRRVTLILTGLFSVAML
ncbi:MAG: two-component sensor histidine kinase, partial [Curvibacter sp.]